MKKFQRLPEPEILKSNSHKWNENWSKKRKEGAKFSWPQVDGKSIRDHLLPLLRNQNQDHCSFCDAFPVEGVSNESVEHFRPKSHFPEMAFAWNNLYYSCDCCQTSKGEKWDENLLQPDAPDFDPENLFEYDRESGQILPNRITSLQNQHRAQITINTYGLNANNRPTLRKQALAKWKLQGIQGNLKDSPYREFLKQFSEIARQQDLPDPTE